MSLRERGGIRGGGIEDKIGGGVVVYSWAELGRRTGASSGVGACLTKDFK